MAAQFAKIDWSGAASSLESDDPLEAARLRSLSALYESSYPDALRLVESARAADPFNPLHDLRLSLVHARFGEVGTAGEVVQRIKDNGIASPSIEYLRALYALRAGRADQARAIAGAIETYAPARFLRAEAQIALGVQANRLERALRGLPTEPRWTASWADLLIKLALLVPEGGVELAERHAGKRVPEGSPYRPAVERALAWAAADLATLADDLERETPGSRGEALLVQCIGQRLEHIAEAADAVPGQAIGELSRLRARFTERVVLDQLTQDFLTRQAARLAASGKHEEALRFVERALHELPHELINYQNRAALFTQMREVRGYHQAWAELNRHQYRLLLLGAREPALGSLIKTHRLFAQQARGGRDRVTGGIFEVRAGAEGETWQGINSEAIAADPDLMREWMHNRRAELAFRHLAIDADGRDVLLAPRDRDEAELRSAALGRMLGSLAVLVPEEGGVLADALAQRWSSAARRVSSRYLSAAEAPTVAPRGEAELVADTAAAGETAAVTDLKTEHLATLADLCLIAAGWRRIQPGALAVAEELVAWAQDELHFLDAGLLDRLRQKLGHTLPVPLRDLAATLGKGRLDDRLADLSAQDLLAAVERVFGDLLLMMADAAYEAAHGDTRARVDRALPFVDRARRLSPADAVIEVTAAEYMVIGDYLDEARRRLARFDTLVDPANEYWLGRADKLREALDDRRRKGETGTQFDPTSTDEFTTVGDSARVSELLADVDAAPTSWWTYSALVRELVLAGQMDESIEWADRAVARCLGRNDQINARSLAMEARGLATLAQESARTAKLFVSGAYEPALRVLDAMAESGRLREFGDHFLRGRCQLGCGQPDAAQASFEAALEACQQSLFPSVLRRLIADIDQAYLAVARTTLDRLLKDGQVDEAVAESCRVLGRLGKPAAWLADLARVLCSVAVRNAGKGRSPLEWLPGELGALQEPLRRALAQPTEVDRVIAVAQLAQSADPSSIDRVSTIIERAEALRHQIAAAAALERIGAVLAERRFEDTLTSIAGLQPALIGEPRVERLRIIALLGLHRFGEADRAAAALEGLLSADMREFAASYPALAFRQRLAVAEDMLRAGKGEETLAFLDGLEAPDPQRAAELAYCRAFALALQGYAVRKRGSTREACRLFEQALTLIDPWVRVPGASPQLAELFERLDSEVDQHVG